MIFWGLRFILGGFFLFTVRAAFFEYGIPYLNVGTRNELWDVGGGRGSGSCRILVAFGRRWCRGGICGVRFVDFALAKETLAEGLSPGDGKRKLWAREFWGEGMKKIEEGLASFQPRTHWQPPRNQVLAAYSWRIYMLDPIFDCRPDYHRCLRDVVTATSLSLFCCYLGLLQRKYHRFIIVS